MSNLYDDLLERSEEVTEDEQGEIQVIKEEKGIELEDDCLVNEWPCDRDWRD